MGRSHHRSRPRRRRGRHRPVRQHREPTELGAASRRDVSVERKDGDPRRLRAQLRHRRVRFAVRPHRHAEPARAGRPEPERRPTSSRRSSTWRRARRTPTSVQPGADGTFTWPDGVKPLRLAAQAAPAGSRRLEHHRPAAAEQHDVGRGRLRRQLRPPRVRRRQPGREPATRWPSKASCEGVPSNQRRPFFAGGVTPNVLGVGGNYGWTQDVQALSSTRRTTGTRPCRPNSRGASREGWSAQVNYTLQKADQLRRRLVDLRSRAEQGAGRVRPDAQLHRGDRCTNCRSARTRNMARTGTASPRLCSAAGS